MGNPNPVEGTAGYVRRCAAMSKHDLRKLGLRLQSIHGGQAVQRMYRAKGITDPCAKARAVRKAKREAKRIAALLAGESATTTKQTID